jgi:hypothetical protein
VDASGQLAFRLHDGRGMRSLHVRPARLLIAGWAGRDQATLAQHIEELAALGVVPPSSAPLFYAASPALLTQGTELHVLGRDSSGEVEPLLVMGEDGALIGLGSDHTDRVAEAWSVPHSKQLCGKPIADELWRFDEIDAHWDSLVLRAWIREASGGEWVLYQEGAMSALRRPDELAALAGGLRPGDAMLCGTLPALGGIRPAGAFRMELADEKLGRRLAHSYRTVPLPVVT